MAKNNLNFDENYRGINNILLQEIIRTALNEDLGTGDVTTHNIFQRNDQEDLAPNSPVRAEIIAKEEGILAGGFIVKKIFELLVENQRENLEFELEKEGIEVTPGKKVMTIKGPPQIILMGERVGLNFLQRLSGISTQTHRIVQITSPYGVKVLDTRKTTPGLRQLEKYAVKLGGGYNHRMGLYDGVMIKDNHKKAAGSIKKALYSIKENLGPMVKICVEVISEEEAKEAYKHGAHHILLDNMPKDEIDKIVNLLKEKPVTLEISGNISEDNIEELASTGVDYISCGELTHSYSSIDFSLNLL